MSEPSTYLLDGIIEFAEQKNISIEKAAGQLADLAKQRIPERNFEDATATVRAKLVRAIKESKKEYFLSRVIMRTRVHAIAWTYYPKYHVFSSPTKIAPLKYNWFSIHWGRPNWKPAIKKSFYFLDDLFFDLDEGKFWMHEPYLDEVKASKQLYNFLVQKELPTLKETAFKKIDPKVVADFKKERSMIPEYKIQGCESDKIYSSRPYGSKGWKKRVEVLPNLERWEW
jgi:hypothetical protein